MESKSVVASVSLRSQTEIWLLGHVIESLPVNRLPTKGDVLRYFFFLKNGPLKAEKYALSNNSIFDKVVDETIDVWTKTGIPLQRKDKVKNKLVKLFESYRNLQRHKNRKNTQSRDFVESLNEYFYIAHNDATNFLKKDRLRDESRKTEDLEFLSAVKEGKRVLLGSLDKTYSEKADKKVKRQLLLKPMTEVMACSSSSAISEFTQVLDTDSENEEASPSDNEDLTDNEFQYLSPVKKHKKVEFINVAVPANPFKSPQISQMADRLNLSLNQANAMTAAVLQSGGIDLGAVTLSKSSSKRHRETVRNKEAENIKTAFIPPNFCVLHWDGKIMADNCSDSTERLAVLISGEPEYIEGKILGVPEIKDGTGSSMAAATYTLLEEWKLLKNVVGISFDTTASNSGWKNGACVKIENLLDRKLFYFACRHHILERVESAAWHTLFGSTISPDNELFKHFRKGWETIDKSKFTSLHIKTREMKSKRNEVVTVMKSCLRDKKLLIRNDYQECAELMLVLLGETPDRGIHWQKPGACHHARWMSTVIYAAKMYLFNEQMGYDEEMVSKLEQICLFNALVYTKHWLQASKGVDAPANDLQLIKELKEFEEINEAVSVKTLTTFQNHYWYLTEEVAVFALFSNKVTATEKRQITQKLKKYNCLQTLPKGVPTFPEVTNSTKISSLIGQNSWLLFTSLKLETNWMSDPVNKWEQNSDFQTALKFVKTAKVVNDTAERGVKLMQDFSKSVTKSESDKQNLLQNVESHRKKMPNFKKSSMKKI